MFRDHSLVPAEAIRLAALGLLAEGKQRYAALARDVHELASVVAGPAAELMTMPLELLRYEGLVVATAEDDPELHLRPAGHLALAALLRAGLRAPTSDLARLGLVLKLRFLHHLPPAEQADQIALVIAACERDLARIEQLRVRHGGATALLDEWLRHEVEQANARLALLRARQAALVSPKR